jgi:exodeoxyribonuclease VII large subunit
MNIDDAVRTSASPEGVMPIGELMRRVAAVLERGFALQWVGGEVSNVTRAASGHWYFALKDRDAQARCVMFRSRNQALDWQPKEGDRVEARVLPGLYTPRGEFQLQVEQMRRAGAGALYEAFLRIKARLEGAGLFDRARKRPLPRHPRTIGLVTSLHAAALSDVLTTLSRRAPHVRVIVYPTSVQGEDAPAQIVRAIALAAHAGARHAVDLLLVVRGGGSIEDLWAFNDERVAHAIVASVVPVVSGVGHETDFTIADFVADVRAPTPTAAAELASPDAVALIHHLTQRRAVLARGIERRIERLGQRLDDASRRLRSPAQRLAAAQAATNDATRRLSRALAARLAMRTQAVAHATDRLRAQTPGLGPFAARVTNGRERLVRAAGHRVIGADRRLGAARQRLALLDPRGVLARGYAIALDADGHVVRSVVGVSAGQRLSIEVADGSIATEVLRPAD